MSDIQSQPQQPSQPKRGRGAPLGNRNAVTHGFYARRLPASQLEGLEGTTAESLKDEIDVMRVFSRKVAELGSEVNELAEAKSVLNTLSNATSSINRLVRTHTRIPDPALDPSKMLRQALEELEEEWPELKKFGDQFRTPEQIAALDARIAAKEAAKKFAEQIEPEEEPDQPNASQP